MSVFRLRMSCAVVALGVAGCGGSTGDSGGASCGKAACGGDLVATWAAQSSCISGTVSLTIKGCSPAQMTFTSMALDGTVRFDAAGTWQSSFISTSSAHVTLAQGCLDATQCTQYAAALKSESGVSGASCSFGSTCTCDMSTKTSKAETGTYQLDGTSVTLSTDGSTSPPETEAYCVSGDTFTLTSVQADFSGSQVFVRQK